MTLTDIFVVQEEIRHCQTPDEIVALLDEHGEEVDKTDAEKILFCSAHHTFRQQDEKSVLLGEIIHCTDCGNEDGAKILSNACDVLSANANTHFGCCECGTVFSLTKL